MLKTGFSGIWFSTLFGTPPYADFFLGKWAKMGYLANYCSVLPHFCCNDILYKNVDYSYRHKSGQLVVRFVRMVVKSGVHAVGN